MTKHAPAPTQKDIDRAVEAAWAEDRRFHDDMHAKGVDAVVARMQLQYKVPLRPDDEFISRLNLTKEGIKYVFHQDIYRASDEQLCFRGKIELVCLVNGRLSNSADYDAAFAKYIA